MRDRVLVLEGAVNCRDIGGYATADGRRVRWRRLWRSDALSQLSTADHATLAGHGLRTVIDLRHADERAHQPSRLPDHPMRRDHAIGFVPRAARRLMVGLQDKQPVSAQAANELLLAMYRQLPLEHADVYAQMFRLLLAADALPALVHCTSGKDRTGFGIALLLSALGVARETILDDYLLTNRHRRDLEFMFGPDVDPQVIDVVTSARAEYLDAAFDAVEARWGSLRQFLLQGLGLGPGELHTLQQLLLEQP